ncbi:hypothetical protein DY000_02052946 [Brassica cretica]|uniref:50S ribosomal protein L21, chloroplastic n=1 Tax=Brassica cretica TaxID=69181 RepID=A0ABQ7AGF9_BRACR|nr:hypothetical protein DY000_02052946 [Brassica cretica]
MERLLIHRLLIERLVKQMVCSHFTMTLKFMVMSPKEMRFLLCNEIFIISLIQQVGGRQYIVFPGRYLYTQRLKDANVDDQIVLNKVLLVGTKTHTYIGKPVVTNATVHAVVENQGLNDKVVVFKYKPKKKYRRNIGHRQPNTRIRITGITGYEEYPASPNVAV